MARRRKGLSKPAASVYAQLRLTPDEKAKLEELADECHVTLSYAFREGARLYLEDLKRFKESREKDGLSGADAREGGAT